MRQILDETLRLWPTAPMFTRTPLQDTVVGGRYAFPKDTGLSVLVPMLHRDRNVWGADAEEFDPDRFRPERFKSVPPNAYRPFGTGMRACIGRQFALQEATLVLGLVLQRFEFIDHRNYQLHTKSTLTVKPADFWIKLRPRTDHALRVTIPAPTSTAATPAPESRPRPAATGHGTPLLVLFGSNLGTAEGIANRLGREGTERGYQVTVAALDDHGLQLPTQGAVLIVSSSYNGEPPENATAFVAGLGAASRPADAFTGVSYTVFGCGDTDWAATYQAVPKALDSGLERQGATRIHPRGEGNANGDFDDQYRSWHADLWADVGSALKLPTESTEQAPTGPRLSISIVNRQLTNPVVLSYEATPALVTRNIELTADGTAGTRSTRHIEVALPADMQYRAGDHLGVLPRNSLVLIRRVMRHFKLDAGMYLTIAATSGAHTHLPIDEPAPLLGILGSCVELQAVATRADIDVLAEHTDDAGQRGRAERADRRRRRIAGPVPEHGARRRSVGAGSARAVSVLPAAVPGLPRPVAGAHSAVLLDLVVAAGQPAHVQRHRGRLARPRPVRRRGFRRRVFDLPAGDGAGQFRVRVHPAAHHPVPAAGGPDRADDHGGRRHRSGPVPRVPAGTGRTAGRRRDAGSFAAVLRLPHGGGSVVRRRAGGLPAVGGGAVHTAFSRQPTDGRKYAQHEMLAHQDEAWDLIDKGAQIFVCGNARTLAPGVRATLQDIYSNKTGATAEEAESWLAGLRRDHRYLEDIWGAN